MTWRPSLDVQQEIAAFVADLFSAAPEILGIDETIPGCEIVNMDPYGVGAGTLPRRIKVAIWEYHQDVLYRGFPAGLAVADFVTVVHFREGNRYEILTAGGSTGVVHTVTAGQWLDVGAVATSLDFEPDSPAVVTAAGVVTEYATIQAAITAAGAGEYVIIPPGTYDEAITLKNGVIVSELFPDTVVIDHTTSDVAVTTAAGGFLRVKEIKVTRANNNIRAVLSGHAAGTCIIYARLIRATNAGTGGTIGVFQTGVGTLFVHCDDCQASGGDSQVIGAACDAGIQYLRGDCLAENGTASYSVGAKCNGGTQRVWGDCKATDDDRVMGAYAVGAGDQIVWGHCTAETVAAGSQAVGAWIMNSGTVQVVYGECSGLAVDDAMGAENYQGTQTIHGNCFAKCTGSPANSYGARVRADSLQIVWGNCAATGGTVSIGAYCQVWTGIPVQRVNGDVIGDFHGALCSAGTQTITNSRASGATADLERTGGTLQAFSVQHDTVVGTITWLDGNALESLRDYAQGSLIYGGAVDWQDLVVGGIGDFLWVDAAGTEPEWHALVAGDIPAHTLLGAQHSDTTTDAPTRGSLIVANATPLWDELLHPLAAGYALTTDANDIVWDQTPAWIGEHSFGAGIAFTGASGANEITVPDDVAVALELLDAGGLEYARVVSTNANPYFLIDPGDTGINVGIGTATPAYELDIADAADNTILGIYTYSITDTDCPSIFFFKSHHDTLGTLAATTDGEYLGNMRFYGVDTGSAWAYGARLYAIQRGAAGASYVETDMIFETYSTSALNIYQLVLDGGTGNVGIGAIPNQQLTVEGTVDLKEQAAANADTAAYGQIWVKTAVPNELWFTDDAGTDVQLGIGAWVLISETILLAGAASVTFAAIPQIYRSLVLQCQARTDRAAENDVVFWRANGDAANNYDQVYFYGRGDGALLSGCIRGTSSGRMGFCEAANSRASNFSPTQCWFSGYALTDREKYGTSLAAAIYGDVSGNADVYTNRMDGRWRSTAAITSLTLFPATGPNFVTGSRFTLYGIL